MTNRASEILVLVKKLAEIDQSFIPFGDNLTRAIFGTLEIYTKSPLKKTNFEHSKTTSEENNRPMQKDVRKM
jgi:hypothetical protein